MVGIQASPHTFSKHDTNIDYMVLQRTKQDKGNHARRKPLMTMVSGVWFLVGGKDHQNMDCTHSKRAEETEVCNTHLEVVLLVDIHEIFGSVDVLATIKGPALPLLIKRQL